MKRKRNGVSKKLDTPEGQTAHINLALATGNADKIRDAIGAVARMRGMTAIADATKLNRESLYRALGETGNPEFATVVKVMRALGLGLAVAPVASSRSRGKRSAPAHRLASK